MSGPNLDATYAFERNAIANKSDGTAGVFSRGQRVKGCDLDYGCLCSSVARGLLVEVSGSPQPAPKAEPLPPPADELTGQAAEPEVKTKATTRKAGKAE